MKLLEIHALQSFVPSLLNRDDTGSHKESIFGGVRRARVSSQSWKKAMRDFVRAHEILKPEELALRSKRLHQELKTRLEKLKYDSQEADYVSEAVLVLIGAFHIESDKAETPQDSFTSRELKSEYLIFMGQDRLDSVIAELHGNWADAKKAGDAVKTLREKLRSDKKDKYKGKLEDKDKFKDAVVKALGKEMKQKLEKALDGSKAVDLALFGRMLADLPEKNVDGTFHVAHAISTHLVSREFDYYTAVDDLKPDDTQGADMIGTTELSSACFYRYAALDLQGLLETLQEPELVLAGLRAFLRAFFESVPSGKQRSTAAYNPPHFGAVRVQDKAMPINLANAFERAVKKSEDGYVVPSIRELDSEWEWMEKNYGDMGFTTYWIRHTDAVKHLKSKTEARGMQEAIDQALEKANELMVQKTNTSPEI
jgi:CRISPR system Cascade subunit CasC